MTGDLWINLPSKDIEKTRKFFTQAGFEMNTMQAPHIVSLKLGQNRVVVNIFPNDTLKDFMRGQPITDSSKSNEVIISLGASTIEEVDTITEKVRAAGAQIFSEPDYIDGWMYGSGFVDIDGHRWNLLYMDFSKMPQQG